MRPMAVTADDVSPSTLERFDAVLAGEVFGPRAYWAALCDERLWRFTNAEEFLDAMLSRFPSVQ